MIAIASRTFALLGFCGLWCCCCCSVAACTTFSETPDNQALDAGPTADASAAAETGVSPTDASGGGEIDAGQNLLVNGDFEIGCANWNGEANASPTEDSTARGGLKSCKVCTMGQSFTFAAAKILDPPVGATYVGEVWLRDVEGSAAPTGLKLDLIETNINTETARQSSDVPTLIPTWQRVPVILTTSPSARRIFVQVQGKGSGCFRIDDASLRRTQ